MKKFFTLFLITLIGCGPSNEDKLRDAENELKEYKKTQEYKTFKKKQGEVKKLASPVIPSVPFESDNYIRPDYYDINKYHIDGCEYIGYVDVNGDTRAYYLTHKGNCQQCHIRDSMMIMRIMRYLKHHT